MKTLFLVGVLFVSHFSLADDHNKRVSAFNDCIMHNMQDMDEDETFQDIADFCVDENNEKFKGSKLKFTILKNKKTSGMGNIEMAGAKPTLSIFDASNLATTGCANCFQNASSIHDNKETAAGIVKAVVSQGAPLPLVKASLGPQPICENGFSYKDGQCEKDCEDKSQVFTGKKLKNARGTFTVGGCETCDEVFEKHKEQLKFEKPKGLHSTPNSNRCRDEHGCALDQEWSTQFGKCISRCTETEEYDQTIERCKKKRGGCDMERAEASNKPIQPVPKWVTQFKNLGCNTDKLLKRYLKQHTDFIKANFESCKKYGEMDPAFENIEFSSNSFPNQETLAKRLYQDCANDLDINENEINKAIQLSFEEYSKYYPVIPDLGMYLEF